MVKLMKIKKIGLYLLTFLLVISGVQPLQAKAAELIIYPDKNSCYVGDTITFTVSVRGAGNFDVSGAVNDSDFLDDSSKSYTITADYAGTIKVSVSGTIADYETEEEEMLYDSATVIVYERESPSPNPDPDVESTPEEKSSNANLSGLSIDHGDLTPAFSSDVTEYRVSLTSDITEIYITASAADDKASVSGDGLKPLSVGANSFTIDVTAEDGTRKAYTINVDVVEKPTIFLPFNNKELGILNDINLSDVPKGFKEKTITLQDTEVKAFTNENGTLTLLYLTDEQNHNGFYLYNEKDGTLYGLYRPILVDGKEYCALDIDEQKYHIEEMTLGSVNLPKAQSITEPTASTQIQAYLLPAETNLEAVDAWVFGNKDLEQFSVVYLMNMQGETDFYIYDEQAKTLKVYPKEQPLTVVDLEKFVTENQASTPWLLYGGIALAIVAVVAVIVIIVRKNKKKHQVDFDDAFETAQKEQRTKSRPLVTDETFFKEIPHDEQIDGPILGDDGIPLSIESALRDMDDLDEPEESDEEDLITINLDQNDSDDDDDWLDEDVVNALFDEK